MALSRPMCEQRALQASLLLFSYLSSSNISCTSTAEYFQTIGFLSNEGKAFSVNIYLFLSSDGQETVIHL